MTPEAQPGAADRPTVDDARAAGWAAFVDAWSQRRDIGQCYGAGYEAAFDVWHDSAAVIRDKERRRATEQDRARAAEMRVANLQVERDDAIARLRECAEVDGMLQAQIDEQRERVERLLDAIRDIDAHATPFGLVDPEDPDGNPHHYVLTVGALHRALGAAEGRATAPKCGAEAALERVQALHAGSYAADGTWNGCEVCDKHADGSDTRPCKTGAALGFDERGPRAQRRSGCAHAGVARDARPRRSGAGVASERQTATAAQAALAEGLGDGQLIWTPECAARLAAMGPEPP